MNNNNVTTLPADLSLAVLDILPNPVLIKDANLRYVWVNKAFEDLFSVTKEQLYGELDKNIFKDRQVAQCNGGDLRVLNNGEIDEAYETVFRSNSEPRETITRKNRLILPDGQVFLVGVMHDITEVTQANLKLKENEALLKKQAEAMENMANTDPLTGCPNRRAFTQNVPEAFKQAEQTGALLMLDIDHFKKINDTYGHDIGDGVLVHFADTVSRVIRNPNNLIRMGGEEFVVVLAGASTEDARSVAERIRQSVATTPMRSEQTLVNMTVSIGLVHNEGNQPVNLDNMLIEGDRYLYQAKRLGRNRVVYDLEGECIIQA